MMKKVFYIFLILIYSLINISVAQDTTSVEIEEEEIRQDDYEEEIVATDTASNEDQGPVIEEKKGPSPFWLLFEKFQFNVNSGYGLTRWRSQSFIYDNPSGGVDNSDKVKYKGTGLNVPFHFQILYDFGRVRFGAGASMDFYFMKKLRPSAREDVVPEGTVGSGSFRKIYGHIDYKYFQNRMYVYSADLEVGMFKGSSKVNTAGNGMRPFINVGIKLERKYSEYFRMYLKPSLEYKTQPFKVDVAGVPLNNHNQITLYVVWGISYSIPILPKCPVPGCKVRLHHYHKNRMFRGNPFHRLQNPDYGEEDKTLIKFRGKNKKRLDPF
jgi:hypothetical protein